MDQNTLLIAAQLVCDALLFTLIVLLYRRLRCLDQGKSGRLLDALHEGMKLCEDLQRNLQEKAALVEELRTCLQQADAGSSGPYKAKREEALRLLEEGLEPEKISRLTGLPAGEVEVLASLARAEESC